MICVDLPVWWCTCEDVQITGLLCYRLCAGVCCALLLGRSCFSLWGFVVLSGRTRVVICRQVSLSDTIWVCCPTNLENRASPSLRYLLHSSATVMIDSIRWIPSRKHSHHSHHARVTLHSSCMFLSQDTMLMSPAHPPPPPPFPPPF